MSSPVTQLASQTPSASDQRSRFGSRARWRCRLNSSTSSERDGSGLPAGSNHGKGKVENMVLDGKLEDVFCAQLEKAYPQ